MMTTNEVAEALGMTIPSFRNHLSVGRGPTPVCRQGTSNLYDPRDVEREVERRKLILRLRGARLYRLPIETLRATVAALDAGE